MQKNNGIALKFVKYILSFLFAFFIIYLLFRNQDPVELFREISEVKIGWVMLSMVFGAWSYIIRGLRWIVLIEALGYKSSKKNSIISVSVGYFTNLFIPRAGELSRCTTLNQTEDIPINKLFGTILIERVIDVIFLFSFMILTLLLKFPDIISLYNRVQEQSDGRNNYYKILLFLSVILLLIILYHFLKKRIKRLSFYKQVKDFFVGLKEGFKSINNIKRKSTFWVQTFSIWIMYFLMTYVCFFCMDDTSRLGISDGLFLLVLGGVGMLIPTPGGIGSYHVIVMIGLTVLGVGFINLDSTIVDYNPALLFPTIMHAAQTLVAIIMGLISLGLIFTAKKKKYGSP